jgi:hypothetical protein
LKLKEMVFFVDTNWKIKTFFMKNPIERTKSSSWISIEMSFYLKGPSLWLIQASNASSLYLKTHSSTIWSPNSLGPKRLVNSSQRARSLIDMCILIWHGYDNNWSSYQ